MKHQLQTIRETLKRAQNGLKWYRDAHPEDDSGADDEMQAYATKARADLEAEVARLREALSDIAQYTGEGPASTPWRDIVKACGEKARTALESKL